MLKTPKIIILLMCMLFSNALSSEIKEIHQFSELEETVNSAKCSEWLLFDIDYTLTEPSEPALQMAVIKQHKERFRNELAKFTDEQKLLVPVLMVTHSPSQLTDPLVPIFIKKLQDKNIPLLGFTAVDTSVIPKIGSIPIWRVKELNKLNIDFHSLTSPFPKEKIDFNEFPPLQRTFPLYENGILFCNVTAAKGAVLRAFLNKVGTRPSRIVFVDDSLENLQSVEAELKKLEIPFLGIHYKVQVDAIKISDDEWNSVWAQIHERAESIYPKVTK